MEESKQLIINSRHSNLLNELKKSLKECKSFYFSVAFINYSGVQLLLDTFKELEEKAIKGKIITTTYLNFTEPKALEKIQEFSNIDMKIFIADREKGFHTKVYIFENENDYKIIIGSSNITQSALKSNIEWNVKIVSKEEEPFIKDVLREYNNLWKMSSDLNDEVLQRYMLFLNEIKRTESRRKMVFDSVLPIKPNKMQVKAMENLKRLRDHGEEKALVIAATGTGKTYMSAFDVMEFRPKRLLFIVHREEILKKAKETFDKLLRGRSLKTGLFTGNEKDYESDYIFATIQTMSRYYTEFKEEHFDYIIVDEAHHSATTSYLNVLDYFKPKFTLGMTATPERCDSLSVFDLFDNNVALEVRLHEALEEDLVIPFHYFGVTDVEGVDLEGVNLDDKSELAQRLMIHRRVDFIIEKMNFYGHDGEFRKLLGFCVNIEHARYMAEEFNKRGIKSVALCGEDSVDKRQEYIRQLESNKDSLQAIFTVDIFNEGVDIPSINTVLMLRPTASPIIFIQQLGRGLRKSGDKEFLTVLDFIGNHNKTFLIAIALNGARYYDKDSIKVAVATDFANIPGCTHIQIDEISKERILMQIDGENFRSAQYLRDEYNQFKILRGGKIPYLLLDYIKYDGAPDPVRFIDKDGTYLNFVAKTEKDETIKELLIDDDFEKILKELNTSLPLKRINEFVILKYLLNHDRINIEIASNEILKYINKIDKDSVIHAFECLNHQYWDSSMIKQKIKLVEYSDDTLYRSDKFTKIITDKRYRKYIEDAINYGIIRYEKEFQEEYYGVPFLKLYEQYKMIDIALLSNYRKIHSAFRGSGLLTNGNEYFLFIDLHKERGIDERINYKDKFLDQSYFQWQSPNSTRQNTDRGKNLINNKDRKINLHLFVRKYKEIDKKAQPYIYIGKGDTVEYQGEKPITMKIKLHQEVPVKIYREFIEKI
ncbi:DEAD/DEAH box helicase [Asaccharospora irregularis]|uniref:Helicase conserved C-terminal domain-containing protein n=1 Tax=Asaccharospora irregularis DSM 2635 TaxID=1121321 RepID=A0A1M5LXV0_9FIRM|nr:DEAD/DEAH box helicase [Asaccharospora irregularis]SHG69223.1 Helicase conserved C-terminal domain-containing protein [Asaccharospora irregularis DSM 2635]